MPERRQKARQIFEQAVRHAQAGERTAAITLFEKLLENDVPQVKVLSALIRLHLDDKAFVKAADYMLMLANHAPAPAQLIADAADIYSRAEAFEKADAAFNRLHIAMPDYATGYFNHAFMLRSAHRFTDALKMYDRALTSHIDSPEEVWLNKAVIYSDHMRDDTSAIECLEKALEVNPAYVPALLNRANLHEEMSDRSGAIALYQRIVEITPDNAVAVARLLNLTASDEADKALVMQAEKLATSPQTHPREVSSLRFALGRTADVRQEYATAFQHYETANHMASKGAPAHDRGITELLFADIRNTFTDTWFKGLEPISDAAPVFICGMFRSGSTLVEQVIAAHPDATPGGELEYFVALVNRALAPFPQALNSLSARDLKRIADDYLALLRERFPNAGLVTDKRPDNFLYIGLIKSLFPRARFIHTTRNALDNCLSVYFLELAQSMTYARDLLDIGHYYVQQAKLMAYWKQLFPNDIFTLHYDTLIREQRPQTEAMLSFLGLPWHEDCLQFHKLKNTVKTESYWQVRQPLYTRSSGRHHNYERHLGELRDYLQLEDML